MNAQTLIDSFHLAPHPEGGFYARTYAASYSIEYRGCDRPVSTAILFLLTSGQYSRLHRIPQDELWHFYMGGPLRLVVIDPHGGDHEIRLGQNIASGEVLQNCVHGGSWFGATPAEGSAFSLVGCTVSPGFCMEELCLGERDALLAMYPESAAVIREFCPAEPV